MRATPKTFPVFAFSLFLAFPGLGAADTPQPQPAPRTDQTVSPSGARTGNLRAAFDAADRGHWDQARALASGHALAAELIRWRHLVDGGTVVDFRDATTFLRAHPDWPSIRKIRARAELEMPQSLSAADVVAWFGSQEPVTAAGEMRLGMAEVKLGLTEKGAAHLCDGWSRGRFSLSDEAKFSDLKQITPKCQQARLENLVWGGDYTRARRQMLRVDANSRNLAEARIAVRSGARNAQSLIQALPPALQSDPELTFDRVNVLLQASKYDDAEALLRQMPTRDLAASQPGALWGELSLAARMALQDNRPGDAYGLIRDVGFSPDGRSVNQYAESQFLAGWIALRLMHKPDVALVHFRNLSRGVGRPISLARGAYWQGRALQDLGRRDEAWAAYRKAAQHPETYYGQLALMRSEAHPMLNLLATKVQLPPQSAFENDEIVRVLKLLANLNQPGTFRTFALQYHRNHPDGGHMLALLRLTAGLGQRNVTVRLAKQAGYDGYIFPEYTYPLINVPSYSGNGQGPEKALVLALIRQETEFNAGAVSPAGAVGLMQVMPKSARLYARKAGVQYDQSRLLTDPEYNMQLGMAMIAGYWNTWNYALPLGAASYNAGPNAVARWIHQYGDPRTDDIDIVDWIEEIPYHETRNYVQRVLENVQVYRFRLAGHPVPLQIFDDMKTQRPDVLSPPKSN